jgi:urease accessory protein
MLLEEPVVLQADEPIAMDSRAASIAAAGHGAVVFARRGGSAQSFVRVARAQSPLQVLLPKNHGHAAWVVLGSLGGGLVDGDAIRLDVDVEPGAAGLVGTQASTKVYRCPERACRQDTIARAGAGSLLAIVPDPVACFAGARYDQTLAVSLAEGASIVLVDAFTAGRSARGERWDFHRYASRISIDRDGAPLLRDAVVLDPAHGDLRAKMGRFDAVATVVLAGPRVAPLLTSARDLPPPARRAPLLAAASPLGDDGVVVRIAGEAIESVTGAVRRCLAGLGDLLGDDPFARRW